MNEIVGKNVLLEVYNQTAGDYIPYICCKDCAILFTPELVNVTTVTSGRWNNYKSRRIDWEVSISGVSTILGEGHTFFVTVSPSNLFKTWQIRMTFTDDEGNDAQFLGAVVLKNASADGNQDQFSQWEKGLQGSGPYQLLLNGTAYAGITKLPTPVLVATAFSSQQINLSWNTVANASGYRLYFNGINHFDSAGLLATLGSGTTSHQHTGLSASNPFYYWLVAIGDGVVYTDSDPASANTTTFGTATLFLLEWGSFTEDPLPLVLANAPILILGSKWLVQGADLEVDTQVLPQGQFLLVRIPNTEVGKTTWFNTAFNNGAVPDLVFHSRMQAGSYSYYITRVRYYHDSTQPTLIS